MSEYKHGEAFMLMKYRRQSDGKEEIIWNSRDGVTPFGIEDDMRHVDWQTDIRSINHIPKVGDKIFVDATVEHVRDQARAYIDENWERTKMPMKEHPFFEQMTKEETAGYFMAQWTEGGKQPFLFTVTQEWLDEQTQRRLTHGA